MKKAAVIGYPITHSLSPRLHGFWLNEYEIDGEYNKISIESGSLEKDVRELIDSGYQGINVTVPHKEAILSLVDKVDDLGKRVGAVNTLIFDEGKIFATNTDVFGFMENIRTSIPGIDFKEKTIAIIGAGGATRAAIVGFLDSDVKSIRLSNRTEEKAQNLSDEFGDKVTTWQWNKWDEFLKDVDILVNTTTLGMVNQPQLDIKLNSLPNDSVVVDIVYNPLMTPLLIEAKNRGNKIVDGIGMLLYQAVPGFESWFGKRPEVTDELRQYVLEAV